MVQFARIQNGLANIFASDDEQRLIKRHFLRLTCISLLSVCRAVTLKVGFLFILLSAFRSLVLDMKNLEGASALVVLEQLFQPTVLMLIAVAMAALMKPAARYLEIPLMKNSGTWLLNPSEKSPKTIVQPILSLFRFTILLGLFSLVLFVLLKEFILLFFGLILFFQVIFFNGSRFSIFFITTKLTNRLFVYSNSRHTLIFKIIAQIMIGFVFASYLILFTFTLFRVGIPFDLEFLLVFVMLPKVLLKEFVLMQRLPRILNI